MARIKRIELIITSPDTEHKVIKRIRIVPPKAIIKGQTIDKRAPEKPNDFIRRQYFTPDGADDALYAWIGKFDDANPNHRYCLIALGGYRFKLVWEEAGPLPGDREI